MQTHLAAHQRAGANADIKDAREQRHGDVGGVRAEASTFTCMPRPIIMIATPRRC
jgi:hypothetical protein